MKMLKKAAAVLLAAAMSLTMLTACGGGSGSGSGSSGAFEGSYTIKTSVVERNGQPVTTESSYQTTNGTWSYLEDTDESGTNATLIGPDAVYYVNPTSKKAYKASDKETSGSTPDTGAGYTIKTENGTWEYNNKTYTTQSTIIESAEGKMITTCCFDNGKFAYIKSEETAKGSTYTEIIRVNEYSKTADESKLDLNNYKLVENPKDLF